MKSQVFTDFFQFHDSNAQLDGRFLIYGKHDDFHWRTDLLSLDDCQLIRSQCQTGIIVEGATPRDAFQFYFPIGESWSNCGEAFSTGDVLIFEPGCEYYEVTKSPSDGWHGFIIPADQVELPENYQFSPVSYVLPVGKPAAARLRQLYQQFFDSIAENPQVEFSPAAYMIKQEFKAILLPLIKNKQGASNRVDRSLVTRRRVMSKAQQLITESGDLPIHVTQLAEATGVSDRTLLKVFHDYFGIGPRQYLMTRQLHQLYMDLYLADPARTSVSNIMINNGILEFGRFSGRYKKLFGELPRETLRRVPDRYLAHVIAKINSALPVESKI